MIALSNILTFKLWKCSFLKKTTNIYNTNIHNHSLKLIQSKTSYSQKISNAPNGNFVFDLHTYEPDL
jgi:hypothetical protein